MDDLDLRASVISHLEGGRIHQATQAVRALLEQQPGLRTHRFLRSTVESAQAAAVALKRIRVALLSSFSSEFLHDSLIALGLARGLRIELYQAGFGTFRQELLKSSGALDAWSPDAVVVAVEGEDWVPEAYRPPLEDAENGSDEVIRSFGSELRELVTAFRRRSTAPLLIHNLALPPWRALGILDPKATSGQGRLIAELNSALAALARDAIDVHIVDYGALVNRYGALNWYDERMRFYARAPIASAMHAHLSAEYVKFFCAMTGLAKKCLAVDLDNTLWGGVIGEDGMEGIKLGADYPGNAFVAFQQLLLQLHGRGVLLAIASKNNPADVDEAFLGHRSMVLRKEHFAHCEINWEPKSLSLERLSQRLSIGLEHIVFVDDNPAECEHVRRALPMVEVIQLPPQPERYVQAVQGAGLFDTLGISSEDRRRGELYRQRAQAEAARSAVSSVEDYYRDLAMEVSIRPVDKASLARAAQLTQKTNQFNVTTLRYSEGEVAARINEASWIASTIGVKDRFGDNGVVGLLMARQNEQTLEVDTLLMSCRVIGRTVETAMLAYLCDEAKRRGLGSIAARVIPTAKNAPARDVFERHGFAKVDENEEGATFWRMNLKNACIDWPDWFKRVS